LNIEEPIFYTFLTQLYVTWTRLVTDKFDQHYVSPMYAQVAITLTVLI